MLDRAVANLVDNALKFSPSGAAVDVTVRGTTIEVADRGPGIDAEDRARVFDRFYRATSARTLPGSGLGLSIVSQIATLHGGTVTLDAREGGGTVARLALVAGFSRGSDLGPGNLLPAGRTMGFVNNPRPRRKDPNRKRRTSLPIDPAQPGRCHPSPPCGAGPGASLLLARVRSLRARVRGCGPCDSWSTAPGRSAGWWGAGWPRPGTRWCSSRAATTTTPSATTASASSPRMPTNRSCSRSRSCRIPRASTSATTTSCSWR